MGGGGQGDAHCSLSIPWLFSFSSLYQNSLHSQWPTYKTSSVAVYCTQSFQPMTPHALRHFSLLQIPGEEIIPSILQVRKTRLTGV